MSRLQIGAAVLSAVVCLTPPRASGQTIEVLGTRALGMGGAFVGVADDATAVYWNPAGLATGATVSGIFELGRGNILADKDAAVAPDTVASRLSTRIVATTATSFGITNYRITTTDLIPANEATLTPATLTRLSVSHYGATLVQTVSEGVVVGGTVKLLRGRAASAVAPATGSVDAALDSAEDLGSKGSTKFDLDIGAMLVFGAARAGIVIRNVTQPEFALPDSSVAAPPIQLQRHTRIGLAITPGRGAYASGAATNIGIDFDITKVETARGRQRDLSLGAEQWLAGRRLGVRGGVRFNALDREQRALAGGFSVGVKTGSYIDGQVTRGRDDDDRSWSVSARVTF
jgi:F plasmid transfer operon, TraF, protein